MKKRNIIISLISSIILVIGIISSIIVFKSNDNNNNKNILAYVYDGESHSTPPLKNSGYEIEVVNCDKAVGDWNNATWTMSLTDIEGPTKCIASFKKTIKKRTVNVTLDGGTLNGTTGDQQIVVDEDGIINGIPTRKGYKFVGWEIIGEGATIEGNKITNLGTGEITLKPIWEKEKYIITIIDEKGNKKEVEVEYGGTITLENPPEKKG